MLLEVGRVALTRLHRPRETGVWYRSGLVTREFETVGTERARIPDTELLGDKSGRMWPDEAERGEEASKAVWQVRGVLEELRR